MNSAAFNPTYSQLWTLAWPVMLANAATPLLGLVDTAVIGHVGSVSDMGALALGALAFNFLYWAFGFLRMGTTGFVARLAGADEKQSLQATVLRAVLLGCALGLVLLLARTPVTNMALVLLNGTAEVESGASQYLLIRMLGAPASFGTFALLGVLIGLGKTRELLGIQLLLNTTNVALDWFLAYKLGWGIAGIASGTVAAEWLTFGFAIWRVTKAIPSTSTFAPWAALRDFAAFLPLLKANSNILIRTLAMLLSFGLFLNAAASFGDTALAANHILLQFVTLSAYVLDGYAHAAEPIVGHALGRQDRERFVLCVRRSVQLAMVSALLLSLLIFLCGPLLIGTLTSHADVNAFAMDNLSFAAVYVLLSGLAFQLDGIFIGAGATEEMRNMSLLSAGIYGLALALLLPMWSYAGLWAAFVIYVTTRGLTLLLRLHRITP